MQNNSPIFVVASVKTANWISDSGLEKAAAKDKVCRKASEANNLSLSSRLKLYKANVISNLLFGSEILTLCRCHAKLLVPLRCLCRNIKVNWQD